MKTLAWWDKSPPVIPARWVPDYTDPCTLSSLSRPHCVCGCRRHYSQCACGCTIFEMDDGTDESPTRTGDTYRSGAFGYNGKYGGKYAI